MPSVSTPPKSALSGHVSEAEAAETLAGRDHVLAGLVAQAGPMRLWRLRSSTHFAALVLVRRQPVWLPEPGITGGTSPDELRSRDQREEPDVVACARSSSG